MDVALHRWRARALRWAGLLAVGAAACSAEPTNTPTTGAIGGLVESGGKPLAGVEIVTLPPSGSAVTNASGAFKLEGIKAGTYSVKATRSGYRDGEKTGVAVSAGGRALVDFALEPLVVVGTIAGRVKDAKTGGALTGAAITTEPATVQASSGADGTYSLAEVPPGTYRVKAAKEGFVDAVTESVLVAAKGTSTVNFDMAAVVSYGTTCAECHLQTEKLLADLALDPPPDATHESGSAGEG